MSDSNVVDIEDYKPHFSLQDPLTKNCHVLPVALVWRWLRDDPDVPAPDPEVVRAFMSYVMIDTGCAEICDVDDPDRAV